MRAFLFEHAEIKGCYLIYSHGTRALVYGIGPKVSRLESYAMGATGRVTYVTVVFQVNCHRAVYVQACVPGTWISLES